MQTPIQFYVSDISARITKHEAIERQNPAKLKALREERRAIAMQAAGLPDSQPAEVSFDDYRHNVEITLVGRKHKHCTETVKVSFKHPGLAKNQKAIDELIAAQKRGCVECDQLRGMVDTRGVIGFKAFLQARYGKAYTLANAREALPDWLRLRAPAVCPVLQ